MSKQCAYCGKPYEYNDDIPAFILKHVPVECRNRPTCDCEEREEERRRIEKQKREWLEYVRKDMIERFPTAEMTPRMRRQRFETYLPVDEVQDRAKTRCQEFCRRFEENREKEVNSAFLFGLTDRGKTHLCRAVTNQLNEAGYFVMNLNWADLLREYRASFRNRTTTDLWPPLQNCELLVLDDLGVGSRDSWVIDLVYEILNYRQDWDKPCLITSNQPAQALGSLYEIRVASRLKRGYWEIPI